MTALEERAQRVLPIVSNIAIVLFSKVCAIGIDQNAALYVVADEKGVYHQECMRNIEGVDPVRC